MISMVLFLFIFMAVLQTSLLAIDSNTRNMLRNEAVRIAAQSMNGARAAQFFNLANSTVTIQSNFRKFPETYIVNSTVVPISQTGGVVTSKQVTVDVQWQWRGQPYHHTIQSVIQE